MLKPRHENNVRNQSPPSQRKDTGPPCLPGWGGCPSRESRPHRALASTCLLPALRGELVPRAGPGHSCCPAGPGFRVALKASPSGPRSGLVAPSTGVSGSQQLSKKGQLSP